MTLQIEPIYRFILSYLGSTVDLLRLLLPLREKSGKIKMHTNFSINVAL